MTEADWLVLLEAIKKRPGMYLGGKSIVRLTHFLDGIGYALAYEDEQHANPGVLQGFQEWLQIRYDIPSSQHWSRILLFFAANEEDAFDSFYRHVEEFLSLPQAMRDYTHILAVKEKWLALRAKYQKEYDKIRF